jgi:hypothetical protein
MDPTMTRTPRAWAGAESRALALGLMITGAVAAIGGFVTMNTQLLLAYRGGTLANVHALCSSPLVQALGGGSRCSAINADYTLASVALYGGLVLAGIGLVVLLTQRKAA